MFDRCPSHLLTERLAIRLTQESDLPALYKLHSIESVNQYLPYQTWTSHNDAKEWFDRVEQRRREAQAEQYSIVLKSNGSLVGTCIVFGFDDVANSAEFGYVLHPDHWGKGVMYEAMSSFVPTLTADLGLKTLKASVESDNTASLALLKKLGFVHHHSSQKEGSVALEHWLSA